MKKSSSAATRSPFPTPAVMGRIKISYPRLQRILVPLDFSGRSRQALRYAIPLAQRFEAKIILFHALEPKAGAAAAELAISAANMPAAKRQALRRLETMAATLLPPRVHAKNVVTEGKAADGILATVEKEDIDMIVMATQGSASFKRRLLGSTAEHVMRNAPCPVVSVPRR